MPGAEPPFLRPHARPVPRGWKQASWYAPALLWAVSAIGSGSVLFTPRVSARYEYALLWVAAVTCIFMWVLIREAARYSIVTGRTMLDGFSHIEGPKNWALWIIFIPQLAAAMVGVGGLAALVGSALKAGAGGSNDLWTLGFLTLATLLVALGGYDGVRRVSVFMAAILVALSIAAAVTVDPPTTPLLQGFVPNLPKDRDAAFVLPWIGTILAGSMGIIWFGYWTITHGYGGRTEMSAEHSESEEERKDHNEQTTATALRSWVRLASQAAALAVLIGFAVIVSFTVLGAELLAPNDTVPEGADVADELAQLLGDVWGRFGFWAMIILSVFALGGSVIANQDGWSRTFADITLVLRPRKHWPGWVTRRRLQQVFAVTVTGLCPAIVYLLVGDPVRIMSISGVIAAVHTPFIAALILLANRSQLPDTLKPSLLSSLMLGLAGLYYLAVSMMRFTMG